ncbi:MAG TPA: TonB family protein [Terriglobales bacterium]|nr:TonB family protein [Terriglobales bacterium]
MAPPPHSSSPLPGVSGAASAASPAAARSSLQTSREAILKAIHAALVADEYDSTAVLGAIAEAAQALTGASAAALAIRREGLVICRGRSGDMAPELGSRLSVDSGISGECLRTGKVLRCDDTFKDLRTDPEVCRRMGLRSVAAVPLRGPRGIMGVLEAFSPRPYAFAEEHMADLMRLAELAEEARLREAGVEARLESKPAPPVRRSSTLELISESLEDLKDRALDAFPDHFDLKKLRLALAALAIPLLVLLGFAGWSSWHKVPAQAAAKAADPTVPPDHQAQSPAATSEIVWKPSPVRVPPAASSSSGIETAAKRELDPLSSQSPSMPKTSSAAVADASPPPDVTAPADPSASEPPKMGPIGPDKSHLAAIASIPVDMPQFGSPVSQGLTGGVLQRKVMPAYPIAALPMRLAGTVVLDTTIGEKGNVEDVKVVSGPPLLTAAAVDAVRQWHYSPYLLNGKPVKMKKQVSVSFQSP